MDYLDALRKIGFTEYEAKVYLALVNDNPATGYQVSKQSGVPRSMVYETLGRLSSRGYVLETLEGRATHYRPLPPDVLLDQYEQEQTHLLGGLREGLGQLYSTKNEDGVWTVSGQASVHAYAGQMIREATTELFIMLGDEDLESLKADIAGACRRGVDVSCVLTGVGDLACGRVVRHPPLESELQELTGSLILVADDGEALVTGSDPKRSATVTRSPNLVFIVRQFIWMEIFTQRVYSQLGEEWLEHLESEDRQILESLHS